MSLVVTVNQVADGEANLVVRTMCRVDDEPVVVVGPTVVDSLQGLRTLISEALGVGYATFSSRHAG